MRRLHTESDDSDAAPYTERDDDSPPRADITPWASQRVRFGIYVALYCVLAFAAAAVGQQMGSYFWTANAGIIAGVAVNKLGDYLIYPDDSPLPWRRGQGR